MDPLVCVYEPQRIGILQHVPATLADLLDYWTVAPGRATKPPDPFLIVASYHLHLDEICMFIYLSFQAVDQPLQEETRELMGSHTADSELSGFDLLW